MSNENKNPKSQSQISSVKDRVVLKESFKSIPDFRNVPPPPPPPPKNAKK